MPFDHRGRWINPNHHPYPLHEPDWEAPYEPKQDDSKKDSKDTWKSEGKGTQNNYPTEGLDDDDFPEGWSK
jgi:hypothetical protein